MSQSRQARIQKIVHSLSEINHDDLRERSERSVEIIDENGYEDPLDVRIVTDETNLLIFEQEVNRYNQNPYCTMPNVYYEQLPFEECEKFQGFLLTSPEYSDIQQQVIFEDPTYEEKEKEVRRRV